MLKIFIVGDVITEQAVPKIALLLITLQLKDLRLNFSNLYSTPSGQFECLRVKRKW